MTIVGLGIYDAGEKTYRIYYSGSIEDGELTAEGKQGARACTLAFHLAPVPTSVAAQPTSAPLPDAPADGTWQGLYKCSPNDQNMAAFEDTGRVFTIKDGRLSGERRWKRADDGATGSELFSGLIGDDGQALIVGSGLPDKGGAYRIYHHGVLTKGHLTAVGRHGTRDCTLDYLLVQSQ